MKLCFRNAGDVNEGILFVAKDLNFEMASPDEADVVVTVNETEENTVSVALENGIASIVYGGGKSRFFRGLAILTSWISRGETKKEIAENPLFATNGAMLQETNTTSLDTTKTIFRKMALMGMNAVLFYIEDTYELPGRPYFGYMRGSFTHEQLKELDSYAQNLGIELIPCIQTLGHLASHLRWIAANPYKDTSFELLAGSEETYNLINDMFKTCKECFTTRRIHIGMDETKTLGTGAYLAQNGYKDRREIYFKHLETVRNLAFENGLEPMMWSDMFFRFAGKDLQNFRDYDPRVVFTEEVKDKIPIGVKQVFWDYYNAREDFYETNIIKHRDLFNDDPIFAGGVWCWSGYCPLYSRSLEYTVPALDACRKTGIKEIFATVWGGHEHSIIMSLAGLAWYADYDYRGKFQIESVKDCFSRCCDGVLYDEIMLCELPEHPDGSKLSLTRALIHNDPLLGLADKHIAGLPTQDYYKKVTEKLLAASGNKGVFAPAYDTIIKVSSLLENKADFGVRLKEAYDKGDNEALKERLLECDVIIEKIKALRESHREMWMHYNTPFGWEDFDNAFGGLAARFDTAKYRISKYLSGEIDRIDELEQKRLRLDCQREDYPERFTGRFLWWNRKMYSNTTE